MGVNSPKEWLKGLELDGGKFVDLLGKLIGENKFLQNNPQELIPKEDRAVRHVLDVLEPLGTDHGGPLILKHVTYVEGRGNLIIEYPGTGGKDDVVSFVGSHLDVVMANPDQWKFDPFKLTVDGDMLRGRGTTDCLGHIALLTELFRLLAEKKPVLKRTVVAVFIANEETSATLGIGVDALVKHGLLDKLKPGPLYWIDTADKQPCIGTGGMLVWKLNTYGKLFHSGLPNMAINALELSSEALKEIQTRFYKDYPAHPDEKRYGFATSSTMKPTQWTYPPGGVNQIPGECQICGDCRITPFYSVRAVAKSIEGYVEDINAHITALPVRGSASKYELPDENIKGRLVMEFDDIMTEGVACNLDSIGFHALYDATKKVLGYVEPYSITGSLPCIREMQDEGFDVQCVGYGLMSTYHAQDEYCLLSDMKLGFQVLANVLAILED
ncbi:unnamed protein product [Calypogeia fissa]